MKIAAALLMFALAGCAANVGAIAGHRAAAVRQICIDNGHALGSPGFDACFRDTYAAASGTVSIPKP